MKIDFIFYINSKILTYFMTLTMIKIACYIPAIVYNTKTILLILILELLS